MSHTSFRRGADNILVTGDLEYALAEIDQHRPGRSRADVLAYFLTDANMNGRADRNEAMRLALESLSPARKHIAEKLHKVMEEEKERLKAGVLKLERWAAS